MTHCPECSSEIADIDTFCAYCGFALNIKPVQSEAQAEAPATEPEESLEPTVSTGVEESQSEPAWMSTSESVAMAQSKSNEVEGLSATLADEDTPPHSPEKYDYDVLTAEENAFADADTELAETPEVSSTEDSHSAVMERSSEEEKPADGAEEMADTFYEAENEVSSQEPKPIVEEFSVSPAPFNASEPISQESTESPVAGENLPTEDVDFGETVPYVPADFAKHNLQADALTSTETASQEIAPVFNESEVDAAVSTIAPKNSFEEQGDTPSIPEIAAIAEPEAQPVEDVKAEAVPSEAINLAVPSPSSGLDQEGRSFTDPNLGISDTDGKKAKLKPLTDGTVLNNRYEIVRKIGGGGMGAVYLANDRNLGGVLRAVKEMVQSYIEEDQQEKAVNDFKRESMLLTSLDHTAIPTIFDYFYDEKEARFYLVMKYISGGDLASRLRSTPEGKINELTITEWAIQIADVLDYLHNHQPPIVYRDLKPSNIMVDGNSGRVMLIDFGIARWVNKEEKGVTAVGTMGYAPPELFSGNVEPRSDIYSLGSTMFHLLTGADPQSNPLLIFDFNKNPRPRQINSQLTDQIEQILMRSVEYNADKRFESAAELKRTLIQHLDNLKQGSVSFGVIDTASGVQPLSSVPVFCGFCGQKIVASDLFCPFCGAQQPIAQQQAATLQPQAVYAPQVQAQPTARLMVIGTSDLERSEFTLDKESNLVGRRDPMSNIFPEIDLSKFDPQTKVSRRHARIWKDSGRFMVEDLGSSNGTVLMNPNAVPTRLLPHQPKALASGDKIRVGDTTLHFIAG